MMAMVVVMVVGHVRRQAVFRRGEDAAAQREPHDEGDEFLVVHNALPFRLCLTPSKETLRHQSDKEVRKKQTTNHESRTTNHEFAMCTLICGNGIVMSSRSNASLTACWAPENTAQ